VSSRSIVMVAITPACSTTSAIAPANAGRATAWRATEASHSNMPVRGCAAAAGRRAAGAGARSARMRCIARSRPTSLDTAGTSSRSLVCSDSYHCSSATRDRVIAQIVLDPGAVGAGQGCR